MTLISSKLLDGVEIIGLTYLEALFVTSEFRGQYPQAKLERVELLDDFTVSITARLPGTIHYVSIEGLLYE